MFFVSFVGRHKLSIAFVINASIQVDVMFSRRVSLPFVSSQRRVGCVDGSLLKENEDRGLYSSQIRHERALGESQRPGRRWAGAGCHALRAVMAIAQTRRNPPARRARRNAQRPQQKHPVAALLYGRSQLVIRLYVSFVGSWLPLRMCVGDLCITPLSRM